MTQPPRGGNVLLTREEFAASCLEIAREAADENGIPLGELLAEMARSFNHQLTTTHQDTRASPMQTPTKKTPSKA
jgi:hypothetical protein